MKTLDSIFDEIPEVESARKIYIKLLDREIKVTDAKIKRLIKVRDEAIRRSTSSGPNISS
jgi:hypothetical protein